MKLINLEFSLAFGVSLGLSNVADRNGNSVLEYANK